MTGYTVDTGELGSQARTLTNLADELRAALADVSQATMPDNAYGQQGQAFAAAVEQLGSAGRDALQAGADALDWASGTMTQTASNYDQQENTQANVFNPVAGELA